MKTYRSIVLIACFCFIGLICSAQDNTPASPKQEFKCQLGLEYMHPKAYDRQIQTVSLNAFFWTKYFKQIQLNIDIGLTATYAWGNMMLHEGNPLKLFNKTAAFGVGPNIKLQFTVFKYRDFSVEAMMSEGPIIYSNRFPYGGAIYNFMFRAGPDLTYKVNNKYNLVLGYRFLHVSNGKHTEVKNPSYEALGFNFTLTRFL